MTKNETPQFGIFKKYHTINSTINDLRGKFCYIIRCGELSGLSVAITRQAEMVSVICGDWSGNRIDLADSNASVLATKFLNDHLALMVNTMKLIDVSYMQLFFDIDFTLFDVMVEEYKYIGPGMIRDVFSKVCKTQNIIQVQVLDDTVIEKITKQESIYDCNLIIKPAKFSLYHNQADDDYSPLYAIIKR